MFLFIADKKRGQLIYINTINMVQTLKPQISKFIFLTSLNSFTPADPYGRFQIKEKTIPF